MHGTNLEFLKAGENLKFTLLLSDTHLPVGVKGVSSATFLKISFK